MKHLLKLFLIGLLLLNSCKDENKPTEPDNNNNTNGTITIGELTEVAVQAISPSGGTVTVTKAESPINGLTITIPQNGYKDTRNFIISAAEIKEHDLGDKFNPISPMITIKNGGGYSDLPMEVTVPIQKAADEFVIGFLYNEITGEIEALPLLELTDNSITVATRHFSTSSISSGGLSKDNDGSSLGNIIISSVKESVLTGQPIISSGYLPGFDDWEFINKGSYIAPGGHCAGQSLTSLWYYYEKKLKGESSLFHKFDKFNDRDKPDKLWQDNPYGYKLASTVQNDCDFGDWLSERVYAQSLVPSLTWKTFIAAMLLTGEPQFVGIMEGATGAGHAIIVHKIDVAQGKMYIADPNFPNNRTDNGSITNREIKYSNNKFDPYPSYLRVGNSATVFDRIAFFGKSSFVDWSKITERYGEFSKETIGNDRFPKYDLTFKTKNGKFPLEDKLILDSDTLNIVCRSTECQGHINNTDKLQYIVVYDTTGKLLGQSDANGDAILKLKPGRNKVGLYITGVKFHDGKSSYEFLDFQWMDIYYQKLKIIPDDFSGKPNEEYELIASSGGTAPAGDSKYVWNFGDGSDEVTVLNDSTVTHTWEEEGDYEVKVELYENSTGKKLGTAYADAEILEQSELLEVLHTMNKMTMDCSFNYTNNQGGEGSTGIGVIAYSDANIKWSGTSFTYEHISEEDFDSNGDKSNYYTTVTGIFSPDTDVLQTITYEYRSINYWNYEVMFDNTEKMTFTNVPRTWYAGEIIWGWGEVDDFKYEVDEDNVFSYLSFAEWRWISEYGGHSDNKITKDNIDNFWAPLVIKFVKE